MCPDFGIVSDSAPISQCLNLTCQKCDLVDFKGLPTCPICGKVYDIEDEQPPNRVDYAPAVNRLEDDSQISRIQTIKKDKPIMVTAFDDGFLKKPGVVLLDDREDLPLSIDQERKVNKQRTQASRQNDYSRTDTRQRYE